MLEIKNLQAGVEGKMILNGIDLSINAGEVHAIMGPNGSGKSTLAQVLAGREGYDISAGSVSYKGQDLLDLGPEAASETARAAGVETPPWVAGEVRLEAAGENGRLSWPRARAFAFLHSGAAW